jgi:hypothetical protein
MMRRPNKRCDDLAVALSRGQCGNGNHRIKTGEGVLQRDTWCQPCPDSLRCFLVGRTVDIQEAIAKKYPCVATRRFILFYYHGSCCLTFDTQTKRVNDWGFWGYSITTSRSIRWYLEALLWHNYIDMQQTVEDAIKFFKKDRIRGTNEQLRWFQC